MRDEEKRGSEAEPVAFPYGLIKHGRCLGKFALWQQTKGTLGHGSTHAPTLAPPPMSKHFNVFVSTSYEFTMSHDGVSVTTVWVLQQRLVIEDLVWVFSHGTLRILSQRVLFLKLRIRCPKHWSFEPTEQCRLSRYYTTLGSNLGEMSC